MTSLTVKSRDLMDLSVRLGMTREQTRMVVGEVFSFICQRMMEGETVNVPKFGQFYLKPIPARAAGRDWMIPPHMLPKWKAARRVRFEARAIAPSDQGSGAALPAMASATSMAHTGSR